MASIYNHIPHIDKRIDLSIIITFYNQEDFVDKCLKSVLNQRTSYTYEIIIIDDGSDDLTQLKIKSWINLYPHLISLAIMKRDNIITDQIARVSKCRLKGLSMASGKYLCFLDGDDYFPIDNKIEKQVNMLECNDKCCACLSNYVSTVNGEKYTKKIITLPNLFKSKLYLLDFYLHSATMVYRNTQFSCYDDNFDDNSICFALFKNKYLCFLNEITFCHFKTSNSSWLKKNCNQRTVAIIKNIDDAIRFSNIKKSIIYKRHRLFIFDLYRNRKESKEYYIDNLRPLKSNIIKNIINYKDTSLFDKIILKIFILYLLVFNIIHKKFSMGVKK